jgi:hypothetical protein
MNTNQPTNPPNADVILERFTTPTPPPPVTPPEQVGSAAASAEPDWLKAKTLFRSVVKDDAGAKGEALEQVLHQLHVKIELTVHELQGVKQAQDNKKRKKARLKVLPLYSHDLNRQGGQCGGVLGRSVKLTCATLQLRSTTPNKRQQKLLNRN